MLANINYRGHVTECISGLSFNQWKPRQYVQKCPDFTCIIFPSGKCRIMGCRKPITTDCGKLPFGIIIDRIQSITVTTQLDQTINLYKLAMATECIYEPELFPALRLTSFRPLCVNVFSSGKIVILGIQTLDYETTVNLIKNHVTVVLLNQINVLSTSNYK